MGVFAWLRRRGSEAGPPAGEAPEEASAGPVAEADAVGIPKQTAASEAADSEAGEGARTQAVAAPQDQDATK
ncbi:hypothetical protein [Streptomyces hainanensis]|uniref:Gliding motility protein n=1 Tax=Streptomyces hainanensis TaxID=402648 RepID=A0A4R4SGS6_9ACTN|nr:hypothetical protein [Streptomyces hainanensis]TDC62638.1 hypothetical protein E1283_33745 [Streptomyces hainanensis]